MNKCTLEEQINRTGKLLQTTVGSSMEPMLKNRQNVVAFEKPTEILKKYDLPLYKRPDGKYVLHRILKVRENDYIICGDNRCEKEIVPHDWVIGVTTGYYKDGNWILVTDKNYQKYLKILPFRRKKIWIKTLYYRAKRKLRNVIHEK